MTILSSTNPLLSRPSNKSAFRLATFVVLATASGAVPVATVDLNLPVVIRFSSLFIVVCELL